jgi:uncharacterized protein (DUF1501 family)
MALTRRQFLKRGATLAAGAAAVPAMRWLPGTGVSYAAGPSDAIVVFVRLYGGNDGLNTLYPVSGAQRATYETFRPTMKLPKTIGGLTPWTTEGFDTTNGVLDVGTDALGDTYALHPAMKAMHDLYLGGELAVIPGVHYPHGDYSHFRSEVIYYTGDPIGTSGFGWMGKYLDYSGFASTDTARCSRPPIPACLRSTRFANFASRPVAAPRSARTRSARCMRRAAFRMRWISRNW